jgi:DNA polymerase III subunit gamma/tau
MSYQVIARKYRPQTFADLTGQEHISQTLKNSIENQRLHHAYLFSGVRGTGKTTTARILAKCLNCLSKVTIEPCLKCASCLEIATGNSIDVIEIDAASNTGVDNVREVIVNNISISPARDRYKIFIIDEVHMLSNQAFNALLKTLEEPPKHVVFIMATTELHKVPDTILSRCQQFEFRQIPVDKTFKRLREIADAEKVTIEDDALREVARAGNGSLRDAQSALDQVISFSGAEIKTQDVIHSLGLVSTKVLLKAIQAIAEKNTATVLEVVDELDSNGHDLRYFTRELMTYLRHILVIKSGLASVEVLGISESEIIALKDISSKFSEEDLVRFFHLLTEIEKLIKDSPQPRFQLEIGLVKIAQAARLRSFDEIIQRLEGLEKSLSGGGYSAPVATAPKIAAPPPRSVPPPAPIKSAPTNSYEEPPGFTESFDDNDLLDEPVITKTAPRPVVAAGREIASIKLELEKRRRPLVAMALDEAKLSYSNGQLTATFESDDTFAKRLRESLPLLREVSEQLLGQAVKVEIKISGERIVSPKQEIHQVKDNLVEGVKNNPAIKNLLETFRGEILEVKEPKPA